MAHIFGGKEDHEMAQSRYVTASSGDDATLIGTPEPGNPSVVRVDSEGIARFARNELEDPDCCIRGIQIARRVYFRSKAGLTPGPMSITRRILSCEEVMQAGPNGRGLVSAVKFTLLVRLSVRD